MFFTRSIPLFSLFGFQVKLDPGWFILALLLVWSLSMGLFPNLYPTLGAASHLWMAIAVVLGFFASIVLHEFAHAWVAGRFGLPIRGITLFLFGGVAEMTDEPPSPLAEFLMAVAGPAASAVIAMICAIVYWLGVLNGWSEPVTGVFGYLALMNAILLLFNLIPAFPLDGGRALRALLWQWKKNLKWATRITARMGGWFGTFLIVLGLLSFFEGEFMGGLWRVLIGLFLRQAANVSYQQVLIRQQFQGEPVVKFLQTDVVTVPADLTIRELVEDYFYRYHFKRYPVMDSGRPIGVIALSRVQPLSAEERANRTVRDLMQPLNADNAISADADVLAALAQMHRTGNAQLLALDRDQLLGLLFLKDLLQHFSMKMALEEERR